jgi:hypothetical protein
VADDLAGGLVVAEPQEARVAQASVARPLAEADMRDEPRLDPDGAALADVVINLRHHLDSALSSDPNAAQPNLVCWPERPQARPQPPPYERQPR